MHQSLLSNYILNLPSKLRNVLALAFGALVPLSFAPFGYWYASLFSLACFALLINQQPLKKVLWCSWFFGVGMYAAGVSWVYVSISGFGGAPAPLAIFLVALFACLIASMQTVPFYLFGKFFSHSPFSLTLAFPAVWLLSEWLRTWLFTGFPWLFIGYAHVHTLLAGWAPITGVMGLSFICAFTAGFIAQSCWSVKKISRIIPSAIAVLAIWIAGFFLQQHQWTSISTESTSIAMVQPNVSQEEKWQRESEEDMLASLKKQTENLWDNKLVIWPEAAITDLYSNSLPFLNEMNRIASDHHTGFLTGIIYDDSEKYAYYNSIATFGEAIGIYHKRRLVPFGEYEPFEWLRGVMDFFNLPTSIITLGPQEQHGLKSGELFISPSICYEIAYPDLVASSAIDSQLLISISNLGWFGDSLGRHQFLEMAQMRALETQHYFAYSTNNGPSAIIDDHGNIKKQSPAFTKTALVGEVHAANGSTPFMRFGSTPLVLLASLLLGILAVIEFKRRKPD